MWRRYWVGNEQSLYLLFDHLFCMLVLHPHKITCRGLSLQHKYMLLCYKIYGSLLASLFLTEPFFILQIPSFKHHYWWSVLHFSSRARAWSAVGCLRPSSIGRLRMRGHPVPVPWTIYLTFFPFILIFILTFHLYIPFIRTFICDPTCDSAFLLDHIYL